jgi:hypothetical protein
MLAADFGHRAGLFLPAMAIVLAALVAFPTAAAGGSRALTFVPPYATTYGTVSSHTHTHGCNSTAAGQNGSAGFNATSGVASLGPTVNVYSCGATPKVVEARSVVNVSVAGPRFKVSSSGVHFLNVTWVVNSSARAYSTYIGGPGTVLYGAEYLVGVGLRDVTTGDKFGLTTNAISPGQSTLSAGNLTGDDDQGWQYLNQSINATFIGKFSLTAGDQYVVRSYVFAVVLAYASYGAGSTVLFLDLTTPAYGATLARVAVH